jgi:YbbR domain-containing protein
MAFQLTKKSARVTPWQRARGLVVDDWKIILLSLVITLGLWYAVTTQRAPATMRLRAVQLDFILPQNVQIGNDPVDEVDVTLEGSQGKLADLNARNLIARANVSDLQPGDRVARLSDKNVEMDLPEGVRIAEITPRSVTLHLEPVVERRIPVELRFEGEPPEGFRQLGVTVTPEEVRVSGPESHVQAIERAYTETISLAGQRESITRPQVAVDVPDHKVTPLDPTVSVHVEIAEEETTRRIPNVQARTPSGGAVTPSSVTVTLRGPRSVVEALRPEDVRVVVESGPDGAPAPRLSLPPTAAGRVELVSTSPSDFTINK